MGVPPSVSFTISCHIRIESGYARRSPPDSTAITVSAASKTRKASETGAISGASMGRIASLPSPPDTISDSGTARMLKSVSQPAGSKASGSLMSGGAGSGRGDTPESEEGGHEAGSVSVSASGGAARAQARRAAKASASAARRDAVAAQTRRDARGGETAAAIPCPPNCPPS